MYSIYCKYIHFAHKQVTWAIRYGNECTRMLYRQICEIIKRENNIEMRQ